MDQPPRQTSGPTPYQSDSANQVLPSETHQVDSKRGYGPLVQTTLTPKDYSPGRKTHPPKLALLSQVLCAHFFPYLLLLYLHCSKRACWILESLLDLVRMPYHLISFSYKVARRSSKRPVCCLIVCLTFSCVRWTLQKKPSSRIVASKGKAVDR